jgi:hypothetical protein
MKEWIQLSGGRNPFARTSLMRRVVDEPNQSGCAWCGDFNRYGTLFQYGVEHDGLGGQVHTDGKAYCSIGCYRTYNYTEGE